MIQVDAKTKVQEISFREWIVCKVRKIHSGCEVSAVYLRNVRDESLKERAGTDRRAEETNAAFRGREWRRLPERRMPEVEGSSFDEFERWQK